MYPPHTSASSSTPAHAGASSPPQSVLLLLLCCFRLLLQAQQAATAAATAAIAAADGTAPARAGVPAVPDLRRQGHEVQPKRADARRDRLQEALQPVTKRAVARRHRVAASTMLRQVPEHGTRTCARRVWRLWAAQHSQGRPTWVLAPAASSRRFHPPPLTTQEPGGRILRRGERPLRGLAGPGCWRPWRPTPADVRRVALERGVTSDKHICTEAWPRVQWRAVRRAPVEPPWSSATLKLMSKLQHAAQHTLRCVRRVRRLYKQYMRGCGGAYVAHRERTHHPTTRRRRTTPPRSGVGSSTPVWGNRTQGL